MSRCTGSRTSSGFAGGKGPRSTAYSRVSSAETCFLRAPRVHGSTLQCGAALLGPALTPGGLRCARAAQKTTFSVVSFQVHFILHTHRLLRESTCPALGLTYGLARHQRVTDGSTFTPRPDPLQHLLLLFVRARAAESVTQHGWVLSGRWHNTLQAPPAGALQMCKEERQTHIQPRGGLCRSSEKTDHRSCAR